MSTRHSVHSYQCAIERIRASGHLFDVGQIERSVLNQLYSDKMRIRSTHDSWPLRGFGPKSGQWRTIFTLIEPAN